MYDHLSANKMLFDFQDKLAFYAQDGFGILSKFFNLLAEQRQSCVVPLKSIALCCRVW